MVGMTLFIVALIAALMLAVVFSARIIIALMLLFFLVWYRNDPQALFVIGVVTVYLSPVILALLLTDNSEERS